MRHHESCSFRDWLSNGYTPTNEEELAATYSRGSYTTTTIGKAAFDGRVRNGNGSDHSFMTTKIRCQMILLLYAKRALAAVTSD